MNMTAVLRRLKEKMEIVCTVPVEKCIKEFVFVFCCKFV